MPLHHPHRAGWMVSSLIICVALAGLAGCYESANTSPRPAASTIGTDDAPKAGGDEIAKVDEPNTPDVSLVDDDTDVPVVPIMEDVDGLVIPRLKVETESISIKGEVPADVGNEFAKSRAGEPVTGGQLTIRFGAEPKSLNPIIETSAVQSYIGSYVNQGLAERDPETLEWEPLIASKWVAEDAIKLSANYPGKERRIKPSNGEPGERLEVEYKAAAKEGDKDPELTYLTTDKDGKAIGGVWVGLFPVGDVLGAPRNGYHLWSDNQGKLTVAGLASGKYRIEVGAEIFGEAKEMTDGSLVVTPLTPGNPLTEDIKSSENKSMTLKKSEWVDVQYKTIYTYFLRDDVKWSDGAPVTADDLIFGYAAINNPNVDGESIRTYYQDIVDCQALDSHTIRMKYRQQYFMAFEFTAGLSAYSPPWHVFAKFFEEDGKTLTMERLSEEEENVQNKVSVHGMAFAKFFNTDNRYNTKPLGTGPYVVHNWDRSVSVELKRNPDYWNDKKRGYLDRLVFKFIPDSTTAFQALKAGEIDFFWGMGAEQFFEDLAGDPEWFTSKYVKASWYSPGYSYYGWNQLRPLFKDRRVRIALSMLFDKATFLREKLHNAGVIVSGSQYYFGPAYDHDVKPLAYDVQIAKELLADAGWADTDNDGILDKGGKKFEFELLLPPGNQSADDRAAIVQKSYKDVGIVMNIKHYEWASFIDKVKAKEYDAVNLGWATSLEGDPFQIWHGSGAGKNQRGSNHVAFKDAQADDIIETLRLTLNEEKRYKLHHAFHHILDREQPYMFLYTSKDFGAYHNRFRGVKWYRLRPGFDLSEWYVPKELQTTK